MTTPVVLIPARNLSWQDLAACRDLDTELWFVEQAPGLRDRTRTAKRICGGCQVRDACLQHALDLPERYGIWGARDAKQRDKIRRRRQRRRLAS